MHRRPGLLFTEPQFLAIPVQLCSFRLHGAGVIVRMFGAPILYLTCFGVEVHFTEERPVVTYGRPCYFLCSVTSDRYLCFPAYSLQGSGVPHSTHCSGSLVDLLWSAYAGDSSSSVLLFLKSCSYFILDNPTLEDYPCTEAARFWFKFRRRRKRRRF